jgi:hypothetical protein
VADVARVCDVVNPQAGACTPGEELSIERDRCVERGFKL